MQRPVPTGVERTFADDDIIVTKTDLAGKLTYVNEVFMRVSSYDERETLGAPHSMIRHPEMPRCVFKLAWERIQSGKEIFAFVVNLAKNGDHYWVLAHITPTLGPSGEIVGYHSNRRTADPSAVARVRALYAELAAEENRHASKAEGMRASSALLERKLAEAGASYDELMFQLAGADHG